jgi:predicted polyphosphate/ATP-dependent NAD kinase
MVAPIVGIIANPASGRDVRRFVAHSTVFDNHEKSAMVRRALIGLEAVGITRVVYMPEQEFGIVSRAVDALHDQNALLHMSVEPLSMPLTGTGADSTHAAQLLAEMGAACMITLGGDVSQVREVVLSRVMPATIGFSALGTALQDAPASEKVEQGSISFWVQVVTRRYWSPWHLAWSSG